MFGGLLKKVFGSKNERELRRLWPIVEAINAEEPKLTGLSDPDLQRKTIDFRERLDRGESLDNILPEAFAVVREAGRRVLGMRHFDVQLIGGMVLHSGKIAEMKTGEGKTLCATLPIYLNALTQKGVHLVTVNDYLARRDAEWMGRIYSYLGLTTGVCVNGMDSDEKAAAYAADITYGQNNEYGFDYLRDNMKVELADMVQRGHQFAIVDEVDSILIDEARTPLIISGPSDDATEKYQVADQLVRQLRPEEHFEIDAKSKQVLLTDEGVRTVEELLQLDNLYDPLNIQTVHHLNQALKAHTTMRRDVEYVVRGGQVIIVDEFTGRLMAGRRWSDGLHQAVEAKEGVKVARENQTLATITFQNFFRMYKKLAGMTGTADTEAIEFKKIYNLDVVMIPTNQDMIRSDYADIVFAAEGAKYKSVCDEIAQVNETGQPILVGTASIEKSELVSSLLQERGIRHSVLNAKNHELEAEIVAQAGRYGAVTISTNMAGRGTDILLGGNAEFLAAATAGTKDPADPEFQAQLEIFRGQCREERGKVVAAGGLHILGTERHESRRIDNQLRGRAGRQGDPGSSRFYVSLEDELMRRFGGERMQQMMSRVGFKGDDAIEGSMVAWTIENAQKKVEGYHFDIRKHLLEYDDVLNKQREVVYNFRDRMLHSQEVEQTILEAVPDIIEDIIMRSASESEPVATWKVDKMVGELSRHFGLEIIPAGYLGRQERGDRDLVQDLFEYVEGQALAKYEARKQHFGPERMVWLERIKLLEATDFFWKEHLANMDHLKEGIGLRGYGQRNPLQEYQKEAYELFSAMMITIRAVVLHFIFNAELPSEEEIRALEEREREQQRQVEAASKTIHEEIPLATAPAPQPVADAAAAAAEGLNRDARRRQQRESSGFVPTAADYAPNQGVESPGSREKKEAARKKAKEARRARKRAR